MGTYGETIGQATLPPTSFRSAKSTEKPHSTCDQCVAPSVAVVVVGEGPSALSLEFCGHHLALLAGKFSDQGHKITYHDGRASAPTPGKA